MKTVGIVTVYKNINYGSKLQNYALQRKVETLGYRPENIDITSSIATKPKSRISRLFKNPKLFQKYFYNRFLFRESLRKRKESFDQYLSLHLNESTHLLEELLDKDIQNKHYFKFICGSDQIWAPNQFNKNFFLSFVREKRRKIAYAPSIGLPKLPEKLIPKYKELINDIEFLSVREKDGANLINTISGREAMVVADPTLLMTKEEWFEHAVRTEIDEPYILCYFLGANKSHRQWVERLSRKTGHKIVVLPFSTRDYYWGDQQVFAGPQEFIGLIDGASTVCTDSYHGMLFSLNLNKDFYSFLRFKDGDELNQNSRVLNFLEKLNLMDRIVDLNTNNEYEAINWNSVNTSLATERTRSIEYLKRSLEE